MRAIEASGQFRRDYKREKKSDSALDQALRPVLEALAADAVLPASLADHLLLGRWKGCRDCHVKPDLVLIYAKPKGVLRLLRLGSHSEIFG